MGEDYERVRGTPGQPQSSGFSLRTGHIKIQSNPGSGAVTPRLSMSKALNLNHLSERLDEKLSWKVRIRYFTWAAFTMNMATGGIANVLYKGTFATSEHV